MAVEAGAVYVPIRPSFKGFQQKVKKPSTDAGESSAGAFARAFHKRLQAAFQALPEAKINADSSDAQIAIQTLRAALEELSHQTIGVDIDSATALAEIKAIEAELKSLETDSPDIQVKTDAAVALAELAAVQRQVTALDGKEVNIKVDKTTKGMHSAFLQTSLLTTAIVALAPAAIPVFAVMSAGALGVAASLGAAGIAAGGFGIIAADQISRVTEVLDKMAQARERADKATTSKARNAALKEEKRLYDTLTPTQKKAAQQIQQLGAAWDKTSNALSKPVFDAISPWIDTARKGLKLLPSLVTPAATAIETLGEEARAAIGSRYWKDWFRDIGQEGAVSLYGFAHAAGNVGQGLAELFRQWLPIGNRMLPDLIRLTQGFNDWANSAKATSAIERFMAYVREVSPSVMAFFHSLGPALVNIGHAAGILAPVSLAIATALADIVAAVPPPVLAAIVAGFVALRIATAVWAVTMRAVHGATIILTVATKAWAATAWLGTRAAGAASIAYNALSISALRASVSMAALGKAAGIATGILVAAGALDALSTHMKKASGASPQMNKLALDLANLGRTGKATGELAKQWGADLSGTATDVGVKIGGLGAAIKRLAEPSTLQAIDNWGARNLGALTRGADGASQMISKVKSLDTALATMVKSGNSQQAAAAFAKIAAEGAKNGVELNKLKSLFPQYTSLVGNATVRNQALTAQINSQNRSLQANASAFARDEQQVVEFRLAMQNATSSLRTNGQAFFGNSRKAIENRQAVLGVASSVRNYANDLVNSNSVTAKNVQRLKEQKAQLVRLIESFGVSRQKAKEYANQLVKIPKNLSTNLKVNAKGQFSMMRNPGTVREFHYAGGGLVRKFATGGVVHGPGGPRSDAVTAQLSDGEFVMNAQSTRMFLPQLMAMNDEGNKGTAYKGKGYAFASRKYLDEGNPRYASGGLVHNYGHSGGMGATLTSARKDNQTGVNRQLQFAIRETINIAKQLVKLYGSGSGVVGAARSQLGVPYSWGGGGKGGKSRGIGRGRNTVGFDCSGLTEYAWWKGAHTSIGGTTYSQHPNSRSVSKRPGALGFPHSGHVVIASDKPGKIIQAPFTGSHVQEVSRSMSDWRWPKNAKFDSGGYLPPGLSLAYNGTGKPEPVLTSGDWSAIHSLAGGETSSGGNTSYTINARTADFSVRDLETLQRQQEARARIGRPR